LTLLCHDDFCQSFLLWRWVLFIDLRSVDEDD